MLVDFFVAGVQKGGTKALDQMLRRHPGVRMAAIKEPHFFDNDRLDWQKPDYSRFHAFFDRSGESFIRGESTPIYCYWPHAIERIASYNTSARIIMLLRHPTFRAYSHWRMQKGRRAEPLRFSDAIRDPGRDRLSAAGNAERGYSYVQRGFYSLQIASLLRVIPRVRVLFIRTDSLWLEPRNVFSCISEFLGLGAYDVPWRTRYVVSRKSQYLGTIAFEDRCYLDAVFAADIHDTAKLTGLDLSDWLTHRYQEPMRREGPEAETDSERRPRP